MYLEILTFKGDVDKNVQTFWAFEKYIELKDLGSSP